jgi:two-component system chemotaxis response regulator CheY
MNKKVLIIDDDIFIQKMLARFLEGVGYIVATADSVAEAIFVAKQIQPHTICCDMVMPNLSGVDLIRFCQDDEVLKKIPIVIISGANVPTMVEEAMNLGAFSYLGKPFSQSEFREAVDLAVKAYEAQM